MNKLTKSELKESMFKTWGRIRAIAGRTNYGKAPLNLKRLEDLVEKFNTDLYDARVDEGYVKELFK
jgi:hypothetical protein